MIQTYNNKKEEDWTFVSKIDDLHSIEDNNKELVD